MGNRTSAISAGAALLLAVSLGAPAASAVDTPPTENDLVSSVGSPGAADLELSKDPDQRRAQLIEEGFTKTGSTVDSGYTVETYTLETPEGVNVEYDVFSLPEGVAAAQWNIGWDWGPRLYMTGAEFYSIGASSFAGILCGALGGGWPGAAACSGAATAAWGKIADGSQILNNQTCYDLSQALNVGWEEVPAEKC